MGFGEHHGAGHAGRLALIVHEAVEQPADNGEAVPTAGLDAEILKPGSIE